MSFELSRQNFRKTQISNFMRIRHCGSRVQDGGRTERRKDGEIEGQTDRRINIFVCACRLCFVFLFVW